MKTFIPTALGVLLMGSTAMAESTLEVSGFIDGSYTYFKDMTEGAEGDKNGQIGIDQVEVDFIAKPGENSSVRADFEYFAGGALGLEQAFWDYTFAEGLTLTMGRINAPIGVEAIDPTDMYQYSYGLLFSYASPSNLDGVFLTYEVSGLTAMVWMSNDWEAFKQAGSTKSSFGSRVAYAINDSSSVGVATTYNAESEHLMVDTDIVFGFGSTTLFLEGNYNDFSSADEDETTGFLVKVNQGITDDVSVTGRFDYLDGFIFEGRMSATAAVLAPVTDGVGFTGEIRYDMGKEGGVEVDGLAMALEFIASF
ncbi:MAG: outer membrane beta-barrel protein [Myxococcota bacterium]|nr:outer membrane beta-barrel protein [Myxococcota bacterium]